MSVHLNIYNKVTGECLYYQHAEKYLTEKGIQYLRKNAWKKAKVELKPEHHILKSENCVLYAGIMPDKTIKETAAFALNVLDIKNCIIKDDSDVLYYGSIKEIPDKLAHMYDAIYRKHETFVEFNIHF